MLVPKSGQKSLFDVEVFLPPAKVSRLEKSWAAPFQQHVLPLLVELEPTFAPFYSPDMGAPSKPVAVMLGLLLLKDNDDLTDAEVAERFEFDMMWHYALDTAPADAHVCPKTIYNFRQHLLANGTAQSVLAKLCDLIAEKWDIKTTRHRLDSTHILSNMKTLGRLQLFVRTIEQFLRKKSNRHLVTGLPKRFRENYLDRQGYFADAKASAARHRLDRCAKDLWYLIDRFRGHQKIRRQKAYRLLVRLFDEQCVVEGDAADAAETADEPAIRVTLKDKSDVASDSLQSPSDPGATYSGHKGKGYQAQLGETCHPENPFQLIDYVKVEGAHESDQHAARPFHENLQARGHDLEETYVDTGYVSGENIIEAEQAGVSLHGPVAGQQADEDQLSLADFALNAERTQVERCPAGQTPFKQEASRTAGATNVYFDRKQCDACSDRDRCPTRQTQRARVLRLVPVQAATQQRRREQETAEFKEAYKIRSGIEATNSHLKCDRGMARLRVRGSPAVTLSVTFKVLAENISRLMKHALEPVKKFPDAPQPAY